MLSPTPAQIASLTHQLEWERAKADSLSQENVRLLASLHTPGGGGSPRRTAPGDGAPSTGSTHAVGRLREQLEVYKLALAHREREVQDLKARGGRVCVAVCVCVWL